MTSTMGFQAPLLARIRLARFWGSVKGEVLAFSPASASAAVLNSSAITSSLFMVRPFQEKMETWVEVEIQFQ